MHHFLPSFHFKRNVLKRCLIYVDNKRWWDMVLKTVSWRKRRSIFFRAFSGVSTFDEGFHLLTKFILDHLLDSISTFAAAFGYLLMKALAVALAKTMMMTPPLLNNVRRYVCTIPSIISNVNGRPVGWKYLGIHLETSRCSFVTCFNSL